MVYNNIQSQVMGALYILEFGYITRDDKEISRGGLSCAGDWRLGRAVFEARHVVFEGR